MSQGLAELIASTDGTSVNEGMHEAALGRITSTFLTLMIGTVFSGSFSQKSEEEIIHP
jgi:hypothetical protein